MGNGTSSTLIASDISNNWTIDGLNAGQINGNGIQWFRSLDRGTLADQFSFTDNGSLTGSITGAGGVNTLSFESRRSAAVRLNMRAATPLVLDNVSSAVIVPAYTQVTRFTGSAASSDSLLGPGAATSYVINGANSASFGTVAFTGFEQLTSGELNDTFTINVGGSMA